MTGEQQERMFLITESELDAATVAMAEDDEDKCVLAFYNRIRSRPAPAPERYTGVCAVQDNCMYYSDFIESIMDELDDPDAEDPPCPIKCDKRVNPNNEHDAAIRREEREKVLKPLDTIYKKFKHLDKVLSDKMFEDSDLKSHVLHDCWQAIKESLREGVP